MVNPNKDDPREKNISVIEDAIDMFVLKYRDEGETLELEYPMLVEETGIPRSTLYNRGVLEAVSYRHDSVEKVKWKGLYRIDMDAWVEERDLDEDGDA